MGVDIQNVLRHLEYLKNMDDGANHRLLYSVAWTQAMNELEGWMKDAGMTIKKDALGNLYGRIEGKRKETILIHSHYDSVENGGCYDGALGVLIGLEVINSLVKDFGKPLFSMEVLAVCDEDGGRFKSSFLGSRAVVGLIEFKEIQALCDSQGLTFNEVRSQSGMEPLTKELLNQCIRKDIRYAFEIHAEQGRKLYNLSIPVGIVERITGQFKLKIAFEGEANHAGTTQMKHRRDALVAASEMVCFAQRLALMTGEDSVATVGVLDVSPGATNIIPQKSTFIADMRSPDDKKLLDMVG
ncbi:MAG: allantoate amidohydrolase, partial [Oscillospiraceae bacterium]|nr:allantoate amidohydrolase [Oscillospiraceae bacterium]